MPIGLTAGLLLAIDIAPRHAASDRDFGQSVVFRRAGPRPADLVLSCLQHHRGGRLHLRRSEHEPSDTLVNEPQHLLVTVAPIGGGSLTTMMQRPGEPLLPLHRDALNRCVG